MSRAKIEGGSLVEGIRFGPELSRDDGHHLTVFPDTGCRYYAACLECPAPMCVEDDAEAFHRWRREQTAQRIGEYTQSNLGAVCQQCGTSLEHRRPGTVWCSAICRHRFQYVPKARTKNPNSFWRQVEAYAAEHGVATSTAYHHLRGRHKDRPVRGGFSRQWRDAYMAETGCGERTAQRRYLEWKAAQNA